MNDPGTERSPRETASIAVGAATALVAMGSFWLTIGWPAPAISVTVGWVAYRLVRGFA